MRCPSGGKNTDNGHRYKTPIHRSACEHEATDDSDHGTENGAAFGLFSELGPEDYGRFGEKSPYTR